MDNILQEIGDLYMAAKNNDKVKVGSAIILPQKKYNDYLTAINLPAGSKAQFMGTPILVSKTDSEEIIFMGSQFSELEGYGTEEGADIHSAVANAFRNRLESLKKMLVEKLEIGGIIFQNDEAFSEFARTQLVIETLGDESIIFYEGKEFMRYKSNFKPKAEKDND